MWDYIIRERFGSQNLKSSRMKIHLQTSGCTLTAQEYLNSVAIQALGAVMSGVQSISTDSYDEAICIPAEEAVKVAQKIIEHESGLTNVADPLGGFYYVEHLTSEMEKKIWSYLDRIEGMGDYLSALESGFIEKEAAVSALNYQEEIERKERIIVGVNEYVEEEDVLVTPFEYNPRVRDVASERLREWRRRRDEGKVKDAIRDIKEIASGEGRLMPSFVEAAKAGVTMGGNDAGAETDI